MFLFYFFIGLTVGVVGVGGFVTYLALQDPNTNNTNSNP